MGAGSGDARRLRSGGPEQQARAPIRRWAHEAMMWSVASPDFNEFRQAAWLSSAWMSGRQLSSSKVAISTATSPAHDLSHA
eukprot:3758919-Pyramimonas_sp.AAC.1